MRKIRIEITASDDLAGFATKAANKTVLPQDLTIDELRRYYAMLDAATKMLPMLMDEAARVYNEKKHNDAH